MLGGAAGESQLLGLPSADCRPAMLIVLAVVRMLCEMSQEQLLSMSHDGQQMWALLFGCTRWQPDAGGGAAAGGL